MACRSDIKSGCCSWKHVGLCILLFVLCPWWCWTWSCYVMYHLFFTLQRVNPIRPDHSHSPYPAHHGLSGTLPSKRRGPPFRRSKSVEVLISSPSKDDNAHLFRRVGDEDTDVGERFRRSVTPSLVVHNQNQSGGADVFPSTFKQDSAHPQTSSGTLQAPSTKPNQRPRSHSDSAAPPTQDRRRPSLQEVVAAVVPFMPAATVAIQVGVYAAIKALADWSHPSSPLQLTPPTISPPTDLNLPSTDPTYPLLSH